jgi:hypothetical protein
MQYVKNVLVNQATSAEELDAARGDSSARKIKEVRLALALEKRFTKGEILSRYLNIAYFGSGAYGIEAAHDATFHSQQPTSPSRKPPPSLELFSGRLPTIQFAIRSYLQSAAMLS